MNASNALQETIDRTITDVINRLHHLKECDRYTLLTEYLKNWFSIGMSWRLIGYLNKETNQNQISFIYINSNPITKNEGNYDLIFNDCLNVDFLVETVRFF